MKQNDGGPAFPTEESYGDNFEGMSLRDYFAAAALGGMYAWFKDTPIIHDVAAKIAYDLADAMLKERAE